jgi:hypothetical protein
MAYLILQMTSWTTQIQDLIQKLEPRNEQDILASNLLSLSEWIERKTV